MIQYKRIFLGPACNNRCLHCQVKSRLPDPDLHHVMAQMAPRDSIDSVEFNGGEPTLRSDFFEILNAARNSGYRRIKIVTNARAFADINTAVKTVESGCYFFEIKAHHHEPAIHDRVTRVRGSLEQAMEGITNLRTIDTLHNRPFQAFIHLRIPVSTHNYEHIGALALAFIPYGIDRITLSFDDSQLELSKALPHVQAAINVSILNRTWIDTRRIPLCAMTGFEHHVSEVYNPHAGDFEKSTHCRKCTYDHVCPGISARYFDNFGFHSLEPIRESRHAEDIRRLYDGQS